MSSSVFVYHAADGESELMAALAFRVTTRPVVKPGVTREPPGADVRRRGPV